MYTKSPTKRQMDFLADVSFTQLANADQAKRWGYNSRTWSPLLENEYLWMDNSGFFNLSDKGRRTLRMERLRRHA